MNTATNMIAPAHHRRPLRLREYDYAQSGAYFVTIRCRDRACLFGDVVEDRVILSDAGRVVMSVWQELPKHYPHVELDSFVIMPNHIHAIIILKPEAAPPDQRGRAGLRPAPTPDVSNQAPTNNHPNDKQSVGAGLRPARPDIADSTKPGEPDRQRTTNHPNDTQSVGAGLRPAQRTPRRHRLPEIVRAFKSFSARGINAHRHTSGAPVWQRNYYEHVIRNADELTRAREYVVNNPLRWALDRENPNRNHCDAL